MKTQTTTSQMYCSSAAMRYAQVLYELNVPKEAIQKAREIFEEVPQLHDVFVNPTIPAQKKERDRQGISAGNEKFPESGM